MTNITIINPRTAWKSDSGIFYTICLLFILYRLIRYSSAPSQRLNLREWNVTSLGVSSFNFVFTSLPEPEAANRLTFSNLTISIDGLMYFFIISFWFFSNFGTFMYLSLRRPLSVKEKSMLFHP